MLTDRLDEVSYLTSLRNADFSGNSIKSLKELDSLKGIDFLTNLDLSYNACQKVKFYKIIVFYKLPQLRSLDGNEITKKDFVKAEIFYGGDVDAKNRIFNELMPEEEFIDRRIYTSNMLDPDSDTEPAEYDFFDKYDEDGNLINTRPTYLPKNAAYPFGIGKPGVEPMATTINLEMITQSVDYMREQISNYLKERHKSDTAEETQAQTN